MADITLSGAEIAAALPDVAFDYPLHPQLNYRVRDDLVEVELYPQPRDKSFWALSDKNRTAASDAIRALFAEREKEAAHRAQLESGATGTAEHWKAVAAEWEAKAVAEAQRADALTKERDDLLDCLARNGFRRCDSPACNCGSWHAVGGWADRFREINEATAANEQQGETLLARVVRILAQRDALVRTIDEEMVNAHVGVFNVDEDDPKEALGQIIAWHCMVALDPAVSGDARALVADYAADRERVDALAWWLAAEKRNCLEAWGESAIANTDGLLVSVGPLPDVLDALVALRKQREGGV